MSKINGFIGRRNFLKVAGGGSFLSIFARQNAAFAESTRIYPPDLNSVSPDEAIKLLLDGNKRFVEQKRLYPDQSPKRIHSVSQAQHPFAAILGCADSRVPAEIVFDQGIGDIFDVRVAGNICCDISIGSLEYATSVLGSRLIMVLGHRRCGAVAEALKDELVPGRISLLVEQIKPAVKSIKSTKEETLNTADNAVIANVKYQVAQLKESSAILNQLISDNQLKIVGAVYDIDTGKISMLV